MESILRSDVLKLIDTGEPFTMEFVTADRKRGTAGKLIRVENWIKVKQPPVDQRGGTSAAPAPSGTFKDPNHYGNGTINIQNPTFKQLHIHKVHSALILTFNGKKLING